MIIDGAGRVRAPHLPRQGGFTLLEVLIAVAITALIGIGVWQMINSVIRTRDRVDAVATEFAQIQRAMLVIERDMDQVVNRPVRDVYGDARYAMTSREEGVAIALTREGWRNPIGSRRSSLQRASYEFTGDELHRRYWGMLDLAQDAEGRDQLLLEKVTDFQVRFMDENGNWQDDWPSADAADQASGSPATLAAQPLPKGVEITIEHADFGELRRVFVMPNFDAQSVQGIITESATAGSEDTTDQDTEANQDGSQGNSQEQTQ